MKTLPFCLGMVQGSERQLAESFSAMALKHKADFEIHQSCKLFTQWCESHVKKVNVFAERHGVAPNRDPARVKKALFRGPRIGGFGLMRDLQDLLLLTHQARTGWTVLEQAGKEMRESEMIETCVHCAGETDRQIDWLCTHIKVAAPQALTVPPNLAAETSESAPALALKVLMGVAVAGGVAVLLKVLWSKELV